MRMITDREYPPWIFSHLPKNVLLLILSLLFLPITTCLILVCELHNVSRRVLEPKAETQTRDLRKKTILITGVSMTKGLTLARIFHRHTTCYIIGADTESFPFNLSPGRFSRSLDHFHSLTAPSKKFGSVDKPDTKPYIDSLLNLIQTYNVDLWISCSGVASAIEDGEVAELVAKKTAGKCKVVQSGAAITERLHEKDQFMQYLQNIGETVPETHRCESHKEVENILSSTKGKPGSDKKYIMKSINLDDATRADMSLLPLETDDKTRKHLSRLRISPESPWLLQEYVFGEEYCTHSLVVNGHVKAFVACRSSDLLMHYEAMQRNSRLSTEMLTFTERVAGSLGSNFTGHLSFDFLLKKRNGSDHDITEAEQKMEVALYPIECNPRTHTAVVLFKDTESLARRYLQISSGVGVDSSEDVLTPTFPPNKYYWIGHDMVTLVIIPLLLVLSGRQSVRKTIADWRDFLDHLVFWRDGAFERWDPIPFWWLYHVYWPMQFLESILTGKRWSRVNVSTTKMFLC